MKELSIEEKAKRYDENLDVARHIYADPSVKDEDKHYIEVIFPELAEPDERIRKKIIALVNAHGQGMYKDEMLAWLEKQGPKVSAIEGFESEFERQVSGLIASAINKEHEYNQGYVKWTANALLNYAKHELEKQGEQKPKKCMYSNDNYTDEERKVLCDGCKEECELRQKSAWSEEDKNMLKWVTGYLDNKMLNTPIVEERTACKNAIAWLEKLTQSRQEWSEEDLYKIEHALFGTYAVDVATKLLNKFKSLRPQNRWKPSDMQIKALEEACNEHWEPDGLDPLYTLYQDLKKLK